MSGYVVVNCEMCKVPQAMRSRYPWGRETIQIGAVLLNEQLEITGQFDTFVYPQFGSIDAEIKKLTGIEKKDVKNAPDMKTALEQFVAWVPRDAAVVSWVIMMKNRFVMKQRQSKLRFRVWMPFWKTGSTARKSSVRKCRQRNATNFPMH